MRARDLAALLAQSCPAVAEMLLPDGKRKGREWVCGDVDGAAGNSLKLCLEGGKAGVWKDFATDESGDLIGLWMKARSLSLVDACSEAHKFLGIAEARIENPPKAYAKPSREGVTAPTLPALHYITTARRISTEAVKAYRVAVKGSAIMFPYLIGGEIVAAKYRPWNEKKFWTDADCMPCLFGWQAMPAAARVAYIVEGEFDALAMWDYGRPALSVPFGGGKGDKQRWIDNEFDRMALYDEIYLCLDNDPAGKEATLEIVARLGRERCRIVTLPRKDANECLMAGVSAAEIDACIANAKTLDPESLKGAWEYESELQREFLKSADGDCGIRLPWNKVGDHLMLREGEVSIWAGINGHGKSEVIGHITVDALASGHRACVASLEFLPPKYLKRLSRQATTHSDLSSRQVTEVVNWFRDCLWVFCPKTTAKAGEIRDVFAYAARRYGIKLFVVDNLSKCGFGEDDYTGQKGFIDTLSDLARDLSIHIAIVAHMRKTEKGEMQPPGKGDVKGSGGITDLADTVVTVWRNKPKELALQEGKGHEMNQGRRFVDQADCLLLCSKQRNGESEPLINLWFNQPSHQYVERPNLLPYQYLGSAHPRIEAGAA